MAYLDKDGDGQVSDEEIRAYLNRGVDWLPYREDVAAFYQSSVVQRCVALIIVVNFLANILEKEIDPYPPGFQRYPETWLRIDDVCNVLFLVELVVNVYGHFWRPFVIDGWNWLDTVIVVVGTVSLARIDLGSVSQIKVLRAFRVLRLFKRVESLNKILRGLAHSIPGVVNAFIVMLIFMIIYAIVAVDLFRDFASEGAYTTMQRYGEADGRYGAACGPGGAQCANGTAALGRTFETRSRIPAITPRGFYYGQEYYGTFSRALYTLFQVLTGESWSEAVVRPLIFGWDQRNALVVGLFFTSYILLTQVVLQNVVVAVLLEKFVASDPEEEKRKADEARLKSDQQRSLLLEMLPGLQGGSTGSSATAPMAAPHAPAMGEAGPSSPTGAVFSSAKAGGGPPWTVDETPLDGAPSTQSTLRKLQMDQEAMKRQLDEILSLLKEGKLHA